MAEDQKIIKIESVEKEFRKNLDHDTIFKFECENVDGELRLGLKEINKYSPYYYESYYTQSDLELIHDMFRAFNDIESAKNALNNVFDKNATLKMKNDKTNISIIFKIDFFGKIHEIVFDLKRKTISNKDDGLMFLFEIQKKNIEIINAIKDKCSKHSKEEASKKILELLRNQNIIKN